MIVLAVVALALVLIFVRAPVWVSVGVLAVSALLAGGLAWLSGLERAVTPLLLYGLALGLLVPVGGYALRSNRVAPPKGRTQKGLATAKPASSSRSVDNLQIPGYEVLEKVGSGGMASVYKARRISDGKTVALKIPMEQYVADAKFIRRFHREAEVAQRLDHMNIVRTYEHGSLGTQHYMAMEYVDGRSLEGYIEANELDIDLTSEIMKRVVRALQHIHSAGIIHRDIKPANIMILRGGIRANERPRLDESAVKLMDFGIAGGKVLSRLTMTGARVGTPVYMSPEQARGLRIDHRSDIYSLGLVFYEMLTGQTAFKGGYEAIVHQQIFQTPPPPRQLNLDVPKGIDGLVMRMISKDAEERPTLETVFAALEEERFEDTSEIDLPTRIVLTVSARQGVLRVLDPEGNLHGTIGDIGIGAGSFTAAPLSVAIDSQGNYYASVFEYRVGEEDHRMIHKLSPGGDFLASFGAYGMQPGEFLYPISVAVAPDDTVYVLDSETHRIQRFSPEGKYLSGFGGRGAGQGTFNDPRTVLVGPHSKVYVLDYGNRQVQRFAADGTYETRWAFRVAAGETEMRVLDGIGVDRRGNIYIGDAYAGKVRQVTAEGRVDRSFAIEPLQGEETDALLDLGVDDVGFVYAARRGGHLIRKYDPSGNLTDTLETYAPMVQMVVDVQVGRHTPVPEQA